VVDYVTSGTTSNSGLEVLVILAIFTNFIFLVDLIAHFVAFGFTEIIKTQKTLFFEVSLQCIGFWATILIFGREYVKV